MNFLSARIEGQALRLAGGTSVPISRSLSGDITLGIRPEHLSPADDGPFALKVLMTEQLGANTLVHGQLEGSSESLVVSLPGLQPMEADRVLKLECDEASLHFFDKDGHRIA